MPKDLSIQLYPYSNRTKGGRVLMTALGGRFRTSDDLCKCIENPLDSSMKIPKGFTLINWGSGQIAAVVKSSAKRVLNETKAVNVCGNKVKFFEAQEASTTPARTPTFTTDLDKAMQWITEGLVVMGRSARGSCGLDIKFYEDDPEGFQSSEFWVQYKKKKEEYRIHIVGGTVVATQKKALRIEDPVSGEKIDHSTVETRIRNHRNGFVFKRNDLSVPGDVVDQALQAFKNVGLDFGAVDVIWNQYEGKAYVLEINTAPGLEGTTITDYATALKNLIAA